MTGSVALDIVIGLVFIFMLYAILVSIIHEAIANLFSFRAAFLEKAIIRMLEDGNARVPATIWDRFRNFYKLFTKNKNNLDKLPLASKFYEHPLIKYLAEDDFKSKPSYITADNFSKTMIDLLRGKDFAAGDDPKPAIERALNEKKVQWKNKEDDPEVDINDETLSYLHSLWADAQGDVQKFRGLIENWFDVTMERTTGWYKRQTQVVLFVIGLIIAIVFNVDTLKMSGMLAHDPDLRKELVEQADNYVKTHKQELDVNWNKVEVEDPAESSEVIADTVSSEETQETEGQDVEPTPVEGVTSEAPTVMSVEDSIDIQEVKDSAIVLINRAADLVNNDIAKVNKTLGMGWTCKSFNRHEEEHCFHWKGFCLWSWNLKWSSLLGWFVSALALSLGAPFWFDLLNRLVRIKGSAGPSSEKEKSRSEGRTTTTD